MPLDAVILPAVPPMHALALQDHVRQDIPTDNAQLDRWSRAARKFAEGKCKRTLVATRYRLTLDCFPGGGANGFSYGLAYSLPDSAILLERGPFLAIQSVKYYDLTGTWQTLTSGTDYIADLSGLVGRVTPPFGKVWPANIMPQIGSVQITYDAGDAAGISVNASTDVCTILGGIWKTLNVGDTVRFTNSGGVLPTPLVVDTDYFIKTVPTSTTFTLSATSGGATLDLTDAGSGQTFIGAIPEDVISWMQLRVGGLYENREDAMVVTRGTLFEVPYMDELLVDSTAPRLY